MTPRHADGQAERLADAHRGAMYMRAEARRSAESVVATAVPPRRRRSSARRTQLAVLTMLWLLIAGVTILVGLYWRTPHQAAPTVADARPAANATPVVAQPAPAPVAAKAKPTSVVAKPQPTSVAVRPAPAPEPAVRLATVAAPPRPSVTPAPRPVAVGTTTPRRAAASPAAARLVITTAPAGAHVTVDGIGWGATPARIRYLPPGTKRVRVTKDGYVTQERVVRVGDGGSAAVHIVLRPES